jgi:hypothetical protein
MANGAGGAAAGGGAVYGIGFFGALIWNFQVADNFGGYVLGFLESLVWPGFLVYELFAASAQVLGA